MSDSSTWDPVGSAQFDDGRSASELVAAYRSGATLLREALSGMSREQMLERPIPDRLSSLEVLGHISDTELYLADRIRRAVATDMPLLVGVESAAYVDALGYQQREAEPQLALIEAVRGQMADDLERLTADAWERPAVHTETGLVTVRQLVLHAIRHVEGHSATIAEKRRALGLPS